jgi:hypothetical protein
MQDSRKMERGNAIYNHGGLKGAIIEHKETRRLAGSAFVSFPDLA